MSTIKNVLVMGAGGNAGVHIMKALLDNPNFTVSVLSRTGSSSKFPDHVKVTSIDPSYPKDDLLAAFKGQDAVVDSLPLEEVDLHKRCIDAAAESGVKRFIAPEFGSNSEEPRLMALASPVFDAKNVIKDYLVSKEKTGLTWTGIINGLFLDFGLPRGVFNFDLKNRKGEVWDSGDAKATFSTLPTVGLAVAGVLSHPEETANRRVHIASYHISPNELLASLEKATGGKPWAIERGISSKERYAWGKESFKKDGFSFQAFLAMLIGIEFGGEDWLDYGKHFGLWNERLGLPPVNQGLDETVARIVKENA